MPTSLQEVSSSSLWLLLKERTHAYEGEGGKDSCLLVFRQ
jgi:hypothetical protein